MSGARIYPPDVVKAVKAAVARGEPIRVIAKRHGMSPSTVSNMSRNRIYRPLDDVKREQRARAAVLRAKRAAHSTALDDAAHHMTPSKPVGVVAAAIAERSTGRPLVVETLEERLEKAIPGAVARWSFLRPSATCWVIRSEDGRDLAFGPSEREAVDRAICLRGAR